MGNFSKASFSNDSRKITDLQFTRGTGAIVGNNNYSVGKLFYRSRVGLNGPWTQWSYFELQSQYRPDPNSDVITTIYSSTGPENVFVHVAVAYELYDFGGFLGTKRYFNIRADYIIQIAQ